MQMLLVKIKYYVIPSPCRRHVTLDAVLQGITWYVNLWMFCSNSSIWSTKCVNVSQSQKLNFCICYYFSGPLQTRCTPEVCKQKPWVAWARHPIATQHSWYSLWTLCSRYCWTLLACSSASQNGTTLYYLPVLSSIVAREQELISFLQSSELLTSPSASPPKPSRDSATSVTQPP
jgi:hypothetical protein